MKIYKIEIPFAKYDSEGRYYYREEEWYFNKLPSKEELLNFFDDTGKFSERVEDAKEIRYSISKVCSIEVNGFEWFNDKRKTLTIDHDKFANQFLFCTEINVHEL